jgi:hypothetical protein
LNKFTYYRFILEENKLAETIIAPPIHSLIVMDSLVKRYAATAATTNSKSKITIA